MPFRHIKQRNAIDCGIATIAMLSRCSYVKAQRSDKSPEKNIGLSIQEFLAMLIECSRDNTWSVIKPSQSMSVSEYVISDDCALLIRQNGRKYGHWICVHDGKIYDPELKGGVLPTGYDRKSWMLLRAVYRYEGYKETSD